MGLSPKLDSSGFGLGSPGRGDTYDSSQARGARRNRRVPQLSPGAMVGYLLCVYPDLKCHGRARGGGGG